ELVRVDYEPRPAVTSTAEAIGGPAVWDECPDNVSNLFEVGDKAGTDAAFASAVHVVRRRYVITRVHAQYMEPRGALRVYDPARAPRRAWGPPPRGRPLPPPRGRAVPASRAERAGQQHLPGARAPDPRHRGGYRRRLRHEGLAVPRASPHPVGGAQAGPPRQVG